MRAIVVTYSSGRYLTAFLDSLESASQSPVPVVVSDNGSTDGSLDALEGRPRLHLLRNGANLGYGAAANRGAAGASEEWLLVANPDVELSPGSIDALLGTRHRWPGAGVLGPAVINPDGMLYPSARQIPSLGRGAGHAIFGWIWPSNPWTAAYRRERGEVEEGPCGWLSGSCLLVRREAFELVGGFDEGFFMYFEDLDLCERIGRAGYDVVYVPSVTVRHTGAHSTSGHATAMAKAHHDSAYRYLARRYHRPVHAPLRWALRVGLGARLLLSRVFTGITQGAKPTRRPR